MIAEWDGGTSWDFTLENVGGDSWTATYTREAEDPFGLLPVPGDDGIRFGVSTQQNPYLPDPRGYCGVGGSFPFLPSFGEGDGICENWVDFMIVEEIPALLLGDVNGDGDVNNLDITASSALWRRLTKPRS